jgi:histone-lysine N-methyltransferase SUV39H
VFGFQVVQLGRKVKVNLVKTEKKGWGTSLEFRPGFRLSNESHSGVFAGQRILKGTFIGVYSGELITDSAAEIRGRYVDRSAFPPFFHRMDAWCFSSGILACFHCFKPLFYCALSIKVLISLKS